ncbi:hypothetical protein QVD17_20852 [Tagetes erecta]|uniref:Uncharacterized protein n=1 Tax=Tagetes erecta TaxID=13708 RepID=A0AAD8KTK3_TARER|nr:hypothetical protein QVD17_20852 [Tagetes erecta]
MCETVDVTLICSIYMLRWLRGIGLACSMSDLLENVLKIYAYGLRGRVWSKFDRVELELAPVVPGPVPLSWRNRNPCLLDGSGRVGSNSETGWEKWHHGGDGVGENEVTIISYIYGGLLLSQATTCC